MTTINYFKNIKRFSVKLKAYEQRKDTIKVKVGSRFGRVIKFEINRQKYDVDLDSLLKRSRFLKRIKSQIEIMELHDFVIGMAVDDKIIFLQDYEDFPDKVKQKIAKEEELEQRLQIEQKKLQVELQNYAETISANFDIQTECYNIRNKWLRIWARALASKGKLSVLQIKVIEAADKAYDSDKNIWGLGDLSGWLDSYILYPNSEWTLLFCDFAKPESPFKNFIRQCGIEPESSRIFDLLDFASRNIYNTLCEDINYIQMNRKYNTGFLLSSWEANSDEDEYRSLYQKLKLYKISNLLFPEPLSEAEMGRFLIETPKF